MRVTTQRLVKVLLKICEKPKIGNKLLLILYEVQL
jgi:hypothetical protein